jgi:hypothetical protein
VELKGLLENHVEPFSISTDFLNQESMFEDWGKLKSLVEASSKVETIVIEKGKLEALLKETTEKIETKIRLLYNAQERELHLREILRLAALHFPRLRKQKDLISADYDELEKWIRRAKSNEGLKSIVLALQEISKYQSYDIKSNLYALVQKIIIEGPKTKTSNMR